MKYALFTLLLLTACTSGEQTLLFECEQQNTGEACNKLGKNRDGAEAVKYFRRACELENTNGCVNLAAKVQGQDREEALRVLKYACDRGNSDGCVKYAELATAKKE